MGPVSISASASGVHGRSDGEISKIFEVVPEEMGRGLR